MTNGLFERIVPTDPAAPTGPPVRERWLGAVHAQLVQMGPGTGYGDYSTNVRFVLADTTMRLTGPGFARDITCEPGLVVVVPARRSFRWVVAAPTRFSVLSVPTERFDATAGPYPRADPTVLPPTVLNRAAAGFLEQLIGDLVAGRGRIDDGAEHITVDLVRSMLEGALGDAPGMCPPQIHSAVLDVINRDFADPLLSAGLIADSMAMSRRQLYRYYEGNRETVSDLIARRRLEHARMLLASRPLMGLARVATESGFTSVGTLRRRFVARYGTTPREYRVAVCAAGPANAADGAVSRPARLVPARPVTDAFEAI
ncbi:MAG: helix-turn-helix domain-containing protein [Gordonia sp. (in: high G+C Gram-positive bacteria)]|uniref:helix-turn-helix domain-containing protein n=1 Tax=Gordonia sp. (in: high G+C Gram-positive bacteria) TaxID=84139 RepID=UPI003BB67149